MNFHFKAIRILSLVLIALAAKGCGKGAGTAGSDEPTGMAALLAGTWKTDCQDESGGGPTTSADYEITFPSHRTTGTYTYTETRYGTADCSGAGTSDTSTGAFHIGIERSCGTDTCVNLDFDPGTENAEYTIFSIDEEASPPLLLMPDGGTTSGERPSALDDANEFVKQL